MTNTVSTIISDETLSAGIQIESAGKATARASTSSAAGLAQFLNATWLQIVADKKPRWAIGKSKAELVALSTASPCSRFHAQASIEMMARFWEDNARVLGPGWTDGDLYLAHFAGVATARAVMRNPDKPASSIFSAAAVQANRSILAGKSCRQVRAWAAGRMKASSGRNWVGVYWKGEKAIVPAKVKAQAGAAASAAGGSATATVNAGVQQGWGASEWGFALVAAAVVVVAAVGIVIWWKKRHEVTRVGEQTEMAHGLV